MLNRAASYEELYRAFLWRVPARYNIGVDVCDRHVPTLGDRPAIIHEDAAGAVTTLTFARLKELSDRLANALVGLGFRQGDRLGILLPQGIEAAVSHVAAYKAGMVAIPLFVLFGADALEYRLADAGARGIVTDGANLPKLLAIRDRLPDLATLLVAGGEGEPGTTDFWRAIDTASASFTPVATAADDPALLIYTSGTTGPPKGTLHAHRVLLGHLPGVELPHDFFPQAGDCSIGRRPTGPGSAA